MTHREIAKFSAKDAKAIPNTKKCSNAWRQSSSRPWTRFRPMWSIPGSAICGEGFKLGRAMQGLGPAMGEALEILAGPGAAHPRSLVRVRSAQGHAGHRRHHRCHGVALHARHGVRPFPSPSWEKPTANGGLGLRQGRHGWFDAGLGRGGRATWS